MATTSTASPELLTTAATTAAAGENYGAAPIYTFSSGLVQITGISTLVGGNGLAEMCLGLKAAPGLAWSSVSCFGILQVVRAFVAGAIPKDTWRDVIGLRTAAVDDALGFNFWTDVEKPIAGRTMGSGARLTMQPSVARLAEERRGIWLGAKNGKLMEMTLLCVSTY